MSYNAPNPWRQLPRFFSGIEDLDVTLDFPFALISQYAWRCVPGQARIRVYRSFEIITVKVHGRVTARSLKSSFVSWVMISGGNGVWVKSKHSNIVFD